MIYFRLLQLPLNPQILNFTCLENFLVCNLFNDLFLSQYGYRTAFSVQKVPQRGESYDLPVRCDGIYTHLHRQNS